MIRQPYTSEIGIQFRNARYNTHIEKDAPGSFYGYVELTNGVLEIRTEKQVKQKVYHLTVSRYDQILEKLSKTVFIYKDIKAYVKELNHEDTSQLVSLLNNL